MFFQNHFGFSARVLKNSKGFPLGFFHFLKNRLRSRSENYFLKSSANTNNFISKLKRKSSEREFDYALRAESAEQLGAIFSAELKEKNMFPAVAGSVVRPSQADFFFSALLPVLFRTSFYPVHPSRWRCYAKFARPNPVRTPSQNRYPVPWDGVRTG